jgi:dephospho-CoA kinase
MIHRWDDVTGVDYDYRIESAKKEKELSYLADHVIDWTWTPENTLEKIKEIIFEKINK